MLQTVLKNNEKPCTQTKQTKLPRTIDYAFLKKSSSTFYLPKLQTPPVPFLEKNELDEMKCKTLLQKLKVLNQVRYLCS
jgi:hypothetical protein